MPSSRKPKRKRKEDEEPEYEVEHLVAHRVEPEGTERQYQIKWLNYPSDQNTWERVSNLNCPLALAAYSEILGEDIKLPEAALDDSQVERLVSLQQRKVKVLKQVEALKRWERQLNASRGNEEQICVENRIDLAGPPDDFTYISECVAGKGVTILKDPLVGCTCSRADPLGCSAASDCCASHAGGAFAYKDRRLVLDAGQAVFECNSRCTCAAQRMQARNICENRVVQLGRQVPVTIFRTQTRGWGLKSSQNILKGTFITEYVGELVTAIEAEERSPEYQFELDFTEEKAFQYVIDAKKMGSVSHFINHSCDPNLVVHGVFVDNPDISMPRIGLFAKKFIRAGTELTFDYFLSQDASCHSPGLTPVAKRVKPPTLAGPLSPVHPYSPTSSPSRRERIPCRCGAKNCRGFIY
ncbi:histone-lysine N-methyltransferase SUV39H2-like [Sycon ciliatum]|uniref:histone-lysine N-methyltransferase SUV39H2-like n=1 Tax=Sycon ciliatum TaxID=27933 RepID=UPI0020AA0C3D|eukprot:scpid53898/ scgid12259/ Histone-lysine N-methyltransferase SUV39H2; Suppressor of variegation 3-9 homolog 2